MLRSLVAIPFGILLVLGSSAGLFWNEGRAVQTAKSLAEGSGLVVDISSTSVDRAMDSKLVHVSGDAKATKPLVDPEFGVSSVGLKLERKVEMYQWKQEHGREARKNAGESEDNMETYSRVWSAQPIDSRHFKRASEHVNPPMRYRGTNVTATDATLGAFRPGQPVLAKLPAQQEVRADAGLVNTLKAKVQGPVQVSDGQIYLGESSSNPKVGDIRISYRLAPNGPISVVGSQSGTDIVPFQTHAGDRLLIVRSGIVSAPEMFEAEQKANVVLTWVIRLVGTVAMFIGIVLILSPLSAIFSLVPFIGGIVAAGVALVALAATAVVSPMIIAAAWMFYRPLVSIAVMAAGIALAYGFKRIAAQRAAARIPAKPGPFAARGST